MHNPIAPASETTPLTVLRIDASARSNGSVSRQLADHLVDQLGRNVAPIHLVQRDLRDNPPLLDEAWVGANFTDPAQRTEAQRQALSLSDTWVSELMAADILVIATPIYNFSVPAALKAWIDQVTRARLTFQYTEHGPKGLLSGKKAYVLVASGGTPVGGEMDFATPWLRFILGFLGITDVTVIAADRGMARGNEARQAALEQINHSLVRHSPSPAHAIHDASLIH